MQKGITKVFDNRILEKFWVFFLKYGGITKNLGFGNFKYMLSLRGKGLTKTFAVCSLKIFGKCKKGIKNFQIRKTSP